MNKFKVGDTITFAGIGYNGVITRIEKTYSHNRLWCDWGNGSKNTYVNNKDAILVKRENKGKKVKTVKRKENNYVILKTSCKKHETYLKNSTEEEAISKLESLGCGYELYMLSSWYARTKSELELRKKAKKRGRPKKVKK